MASRSAVLIRWLVAASSALLLPLALIACADDDETAVPLDDDAALVRGAEVYASSCASCHGSDLRGTDKGPSHLSIVYEPGHHNDDSFRSAIANGVPQHHWPFGDMDPVPGLSPTDVESVIAFVRSEQQRLGFEQ